MPQHRHQETFTRLARNDGWPFLAALEQSGARGEIQIPANLVAAMTFHAVLLKQHAHITFKQRQPLGHLRRVLFGYLGRSQ